MFKFDHKLAKNIDFVDYEQIKRNVRIPFVFKRGQQTFNRLMQD